MGRWSLLDLSGESQGQETKTKLQSVARQLLVRWGVVFCNLLTRESLGLAWCDLLTVYRRMEAQRQVRGGRFVSGFVGEQFALPEAVDALRSLRSSQPGGEVIRISAADPLNLTGIITPGPRIRSHFRNLLYYRDGVPVDEETFLSASLKSNAPMGTPHQ
jgi:ATP-dependent Lhr-like helicase